MALLASNVDIDLSQLTEQERIAILEVVRRDKELRQNELDYIEKLQSDVDALREFVVREHENKCARCGVEFWWLLRNGELCEECHRKVCVNCRRPVKSNNGTTDVKGWMCILCSKERELRAMTGAWFYQSLKFRRSKRLRKSNRSRPPVFEVKSESVGSPPSPNPPVEYFYYYLFNGCGVVDDMVGADEVDSMSRSSRGLLRRPPRSLSDQLTLDNDSDSLSVISEDSEADSEASDEESLSSLLDVNDNGENYEDADDHRLARVRFSSSFDQNFGAVVEHNRQLLLRQGQGYISENSEEFAKLVAEQIVGNMVQMKKDYVEMQLAAERLTPGVGDSAPAAEANNDEEIDYDDALALLNEFSSPETSPHGSTAQDAPITQATASEQKPEADANQQKRPVTSNTGKLYVDDEDGSRFTDDVKSSLARNVINIKSSPSQVTVHVQPLPSVDIVDMRVAPPGGVDENLSSANLSKPETDAVQLHINSATASTSQLTAPIITTESGECFSCDVESWPSMVIVDIVSTPPADDADVQLLPPGDTADSRSLPLNSDVSDISGDATQRISLEETSPNVTVEASYEVYCSESMSVNGDELSTPATAAADSGDPPMTDIDWWSSTIILDAQPLPLLNVREVQSSPPMGVLDSDSSVAFSGDDELDMPLENASQRDLGSPDPSECTILDDVELSAPANVHKCDKSSPSAGVEKVTSTPSSLVTDVHQLSPARIADVGQSSLLEEVVDVRSLSSMTAASSAHVMQDFSLERRSELTLRPDSEPSEHENSTTSDDDEYSVPAADINEYDGCFDNQERLHSTNVSDIETSSAGLAADVQLSPVAIVAQAQSVPPEGTEAVGDISAVDRMDVESLSSECFADCDSVDEPPVVTKVAETAAKDTLVSATVTYDSEHAQDTNSPLCVATSGNVDMKQDTASLLVNDSGILQTKNRRSDGFAEIGEEITQQQYYSDSGNDRLSPTRSQTERGATEDWASQLLSSYENLYSKSQMSCQNDSSNDERYWFGAAIAPDHHVDFTATDSDSAENASIDTKHRTLFNLEEEDSGIFNGSSNEDKPRELAVDTHAMESNINSLARDSDSGRKTVDEFELLMREANIHGTFDDSYAGDWNVRESDNDNIQTSLQRCRPDSPSLENNGLVCASVTVHSDDDQLQSVVGDIETASLQSPSQMRTDVEQAVFQIGNGATPSEDVTIRHDNGIADNNVDTSLSVSSPVSNIELSADQRITSDSVFVSPEGNGSHHLPIHNSLAIETDEQEADDIDDAFHSQSSHTTPRSIDDSCRDPRTKSTSGISSAGSQESLSSGVSSMNQVKVSGEICLDIAYNNRYIMLEVLIKECRNLAAASGKSSNPYVKVYLLPDKSRAGKKKTKIVKKTLNPTFDETMRYDIAKNETLDRTLWISVWHSGRFGRNVFLGDVLIPLESVNMAGGKPAWFQLLQQGREKWKSLASLSVRTVVDLSLKYVSPDPTKSRKSKTTKGELHVMINEANGLMSSKSSGISSAFCKICLLPEKMSRHARQKTSIVKHSSNPSWNQEFVFPDVTLEDLVSVRTLELTLWDHERLGSNSCIGRVVLSTGTSADIERRSVSGQGGDVSVWQRMLNNPNEWSRGTVVLQQPTDHP